MDLALSTWIDLYVFPGGRRQFALAQVGQVAETRGWAELAEHCASSVEHEKSLRNLVRSRKSALNHPTNPELMTLDPQIDRTVGAVVRIVNEATFSLRDEAIAARARTLLDELFPGGAAAITRRDYVEQSTEIDSILGPLERDYADVIEALGLKRYLNQLADLNDQFRALLAKEPREEVSAAAVRAAAEEGQRNLLQAVAMILGRHPTESESDQQARAALLGPVTEQCQAISSYTRARRAVHDVDPTNGAETPAVPSGPAEPVVELEPSPAPTDAGASPTA